MLVAALAAVALVVARPVRLVALVVARPVRLVALVVARPVRPVARLARPVALVVEQPVRPVAQPVAPVARGAALESSVAQAEHTPCTWPSSTPQPPAALPPRERPLRPSSRTPARSPNARRPPHETSLSRHWEGDGATAPQVFPSMNFETDTDTSTRGRRKAFIGGRVWWLLAVWLASTTAVAQEASPSSGGAGTDAAKPMQGPQSPASAAEEAAAKEAAARERLAREERTAKELAALHADFDALQTQLASERAARTAGESALGAQVDALATAANQAPPEVSTARTGLSLTGFVQADLMFRQSSQNQLSPSGTPLNQNEVFIRRARLRASLDRSWVAGLVEFDGNTVNGPQARIIGAEASLKLPPESGHSMPLLMATIGMFKIPFGFEVGQSDRERLFLDRSTAEHGLFPGEYDAGARLMGGWRFVRYVLAVMNGEPIGERSFPLRDPNSSKDVVGRVGIETPITPTVWVAGGFSGLGGKGFHAGTPATKATVQWNDSNGNGIPDNGETQIIPGSAAVSSKNFTRFGYGGDLRVGINEPRLGSTVLYGEIYWAKNLDRGVLPADPIAFSRDYRELGLYVGVTQDLGPHAAVGARYDFYNPDADSVNTVMGATLPTALAYQTLALVAALRAPAGRLIAEFDLNRNHNGRDLEGNPTNLADNAFTIRGEVSF